MKKIPVLVLISSLALSISAVQAKDTNKNDQADFCSTKKEQSICDGNNGWKSHDKVKLDHAKDKKARKQKPDNKSKKSKQHKHNKKPVQVEAVPEINGSESAMAFLLAAALILTGREKRKIRPFDPFRESA